jgi:dihydropteridine reductase
MASKKYALVLGGSGALGRTILSTFKTYPSVSTINIDFKENPDASFNIGYSATKSPSEIMSEVQSILKTQKLESIINVAGGWTGGNLASPEIFDSVHLMHSQSVSSSILAAHMATQVLKE